MSEHSVQCMANTTKGIRCKNIGKYTSNIDGQYCFYHVHKENENCSICLSPLYDIFHLQCGHQFHSKCALNWLRYKNNCPICRQLILNDEDVSMYTDMLSNISEIYIHVAIDIEFESNNSSLFNNQLIELGIIQSN